MKRLALLLLLLCAAGFAQELEAQSLEYVKLKIDLSRDIKLSSQASSATFTSYDLPQVSIIEPLSPEYTKETDEFGNTYLKREWEKEKDLSYSFQLEVESHLIRNRLQGPSKFPYATPPSMDKYLESGEYAKMTPEIESLSQQVIGDASDTFEAAVLLAHWVNTNIEYDSSYGGVALASDEVLEGKRGTCDEFAHLFIAMARSVGLPARYISGLTYGTFGLERGGVVDWYAHGWAEVYLGEWVPMDPTYGEFGYVDATHIPFARAPDQKYLESKISWRPDSVTPTISQLSHKVEIIKSSRLSKPLQRLSGGFDTATVSAESVPLFLTTLTSDFCTASDLSIVYSDPASDAPKLSLLMGEGSQLVLTCAAPETLYWLFQPPAGLDPGYVYSYEVVAYHPQGEMRDTVKIDPTLLDSTETYLTLDRETAPAGEFVKASATASSRSPRQGMLFLDGRLHDTLSFEKSVSNTWDLKAEGKGFHQAVFYAPSKAASAVFSVSSGDILLEVTGPDSVKPGQQYEFTLTPSGGSGSATFSLKLFKTFTTISDLSAGPVKFSVGIPADASGTAYAKATATSSFGTAEAVKKVEVVDESGKPVEKKPAATTPAPDENGGSFIYRLIQFISQLLAGLTGKV